MLTAERSGPAPATAEAPQNLVLEVSEVDVYYGPIQALRRVSLHVAEREMVALVGANGAGKSTTLRAISGLLRPSHGEIRLEGNQVSGRAPQEIVKLGIAHAPEGRDLFPTLSVIDNLQLGHWIRRGDRRDYEAQRERVMEYFPKLRERARQAAGTLSGGEQQMLVIARALMSSPKVLVVDELSLGLAPLIVQQLFEILHEVNAAGTSVLLVEQFVHMALANTGRAYALAKGEVVLEGKSSDLLAEPDLIAAYLGGGH
ncbi:MAG TPA: ABC transporter ATP-binding protein [Candidatus Dormibacteraeota bacterium]|nr:ABC transporter ATP-binding protein [Candidatus Dormibacteraeota bacterium]